MLIKRRRFALGIEANSLFVCPETVHTPVDAAIKFVPGGPLTMSLTLYFGSYSNKL
jgi:hypothetical protein